MMAEASRIVLNGFEVSAECEEYGKDVGFDLVGSKRQTHSPEQRLTNR
jgi:hypothetical protein